MMGFVVNTGRYVSLPFLVSEAEFVEIIYSALLWHSRGTVNKEARLLPSGQGVRLAQRE